MIKWALSEVKKQEGEAAANREAALAERVPAFPDIGFSSLNSLFKPFSDSLDEEALKQLCRDLHGKGWVERLMRGIKKRRKILNS